MPNQNIAATRSSSTTLPPWMEAIARRTAERSDVASNAPFTPYTGQRVAGLTPFHRQYQQRAMQGSGYQPYLQNANQLAQRSATPFPQSYQSYRNPYQQDVVNRIAELGQENFRERVLPSLENAFVGLGHHGSSQHQEFAARAARDSQRETLARQAQLLHQGYGQAADIHAGDQSRGIGAANTIAGLGQAQQQGFQNDSSNLLNAGELERGNQQNELNAGYEEFMRRQQYPGQQIAQNVSTLQSIPHSTRSATNVNQGSIENADEVNTWGNLGSIAGQLYGMRMGQGRKKGGSISKSKKKPSIGNNSLMESSIVRHPKVGGKFSMKKGIK